MTAAKLAARPAQLMPVLLGLAACLQGVLLTVLWEVCCELLEVLGSLVRSYDEVDLVNSVKLKVCKFGEIAIGLKLT